MNAQERALVDVALLLDSNGLPYMIIGGLANAVWGVPRATLDVDVTVWPGSRPLAAVIGVVTCAFSALVEEPLAFVETTRVLPVESAAGVRVDVVFGMLPYEEEAIRRAVPRDIAGTAVRFCTAEDLVLMKIISDRPKDLDDVQQVLARQRGHLDLGYLEPRVHELAALLDRPGLVAFYEEALGDRPA